MRWRSSTGSLVLRRQGARSLTGDQAGTPPTALIDWQRARSALDDDPQRLRTFLDAVIEILPGLLKSVEQAIQAGDGAGLQFAARTLMDTIRYLGADDAMNMAIELERMGRDDRLREADEVFPAFVLTIERILKACGDYDGERSSRDLT